MKKLLGLIAVVFTLTTQNALGFYTQCIDPKQDCRNKICKSHGGMKLQFPPKGDTPHAKELGILGEYNACEKFLCVCNGD